MAVEKKNMKALRNRVRAFIKHCDADFSHTEYLKPLANRIGIRFVRWNPASSEVLVYFYDKKNPDSYKDYSFAYRWIYYRGHFAFSNVWENANELCMHIRQDENF